ncbi:MAG TPA: hypothetical protein DDZ83_02745, partial [Nitrospinae bacterium]|nr:hypothetical protein [Nitrospinota bacterium]
MKRAWARSSSGSRPTGARFKKSRSIIFTRSSASRPGEWNAQQGGPSWKLGVPRAEVGARARGARRCGLGVPPCGHARSHRARLGGAVRGGAGAGDDPDHGRSARPHRRPRGILHEGCGHLGHLGEVPFGRRIRKLIHFSTVSVYSDRVTNLSITEETPVNPSSFYGIARLAGEGLLRDCTGRAGTPAVFLRPCRFYGPGDLS